LDINLKMIKKLFGGRFEIILYDLDLKLKEKLEEEVYSLGLRLQNIFNFYDKTSELSILNSKDKLKVSDEFLNLLKKSLEVCELTNGVYDVSFGENIKLRKSGEKIKKLNYSYKDIKILGNLVSLPIEMKLDFGSCAKGYIVDLMVKFLKDNGASEGFIDADGDMIVFGEKEYIIGITNPRNKSKNLCNIKLKNSSVATSGDYNQFYGEHDNSHIINQKDVVSVTVEAESLFLADIYSTALFVLDKREREELIKKKKLKCIIVDKDNLNLK